MTSWYDQSADEPCFGALCSCLPYPFSSFALPLDGGTTTNESPRKLTYPAAKIATHFRWTFDASNAQLVDASGEFIALTLGDAMIAMVLLSWITPLTGVVNWDTI